MPDTYHNRLRWLCIGVLLLAAAIYYSASTSFQHGLTATYFSDAEFNSVAKTRLESVAMVSSNDKIISRDNPFSIRWDGYLWIEKSRQTAFTLPSGVHTRLLLDGKLVFESNGDALAQSPTFIHTLGPGSHALTFELARADSNTGFFSAGLEWKTFFGQRLIAPPFLYPSAPDDAKAQGEFLRAQARTAAVWMAALAALGLLGVSYTARQKSLEQRELWGLIIVAAFALSLRLTYLNDLVNQIPNFDAFPVGSDHRTYEAAARNFVRGLWPPQTEFYRQPGFSWLLGNFHALFGPSVRPFQIMQLTTGALASMPVYAIGKRIFGAPTGWVAALLWATFPLAIFYDAQLVTHGLEAQIVIWLMWFWLCSIKRPHTGTLFVLGLLSGGAAVIRPALLPLIPLAAISLLITSRPAWHQGVSRGLVLLGVAALPIIPVTLHNYSHSGRFQLISANGPVTLYLGNNRDAAGIGQYSQAFRATHERVNRGETTYVEATISDIRSAPGRWLGLMTRKTALYFGNLEIPNNVDFVAEGAAVSPLLAKTPLRFGSIVALGLVGITLALARPRAYIPGLWMLTTVLLVLFLTTVVFHVVSRFRVPTYGPFILLAASALVEVGRLFSIRSARASALPIGLLGASSALIMTLPWLANNSIPPPTLPEPPAMSVRTQTAFGKTLELSGYAPLPAVEPGEPLFITLYWTPSTQLPTDYYGTVQLLAPDGQKLTQVDQQLGAGSFPHHPSKKWTPGQTVADQYLLFPPRDAPTPLGLTVLVAVYNRETGERLGETTLRPLPLTFSESVALPEDATPVHATIGPATLIAYHAEIDDSELSLTFYWESIEPASVDGVVFLHLFDSSGDFVLGQDLPPRAGTYPMTAWQPGEGIVDARIIPMGALPTGEYAVFVGAYDPDTGERFPMVDNTGHNLPDASLKLFQTYFRSG